MTSPTLYLIRHGEKDKNLLTGEDEDGLSTLGVSRAQQLVKVFGKKSQYNIGCILAQHPKKSGKRIRPFQTVKPLADSRPGVIFNSDIDRDDIGEVANFIKHYVSHYQNQGNVLICWEHKQLNDIAMAIINSSDIGNGETNIPAAEYPSNRFDIIWTMSAPYDKISDTTSEHCTPQDDAFKNDGGYNYVSDSQSASAPTELTS